ncbi:MAG: cation:proton antiporter, partial [Gemmataceae bacterium]
SAQMIFVGVPLSLVCHLFGMPWNAALLAGFAGALSSTVLVFKALSEYGESETPHGRRALAILLFQDVSLVPLLLLVPVLTGMGESVNVWVFLRLIGKAGLFLCGAGLAHWVIKHWVVPGLARLRTVELVVLFAVSVLVGMAYGAWSLGLPPAVGALAAGLILSGQRLSKQIDTILIPFRETFSAVFFVSLGMLIHFRIFLDEPILLSFGLVAMVLLKTLAAAAALRLTGTSWRTALGMGLGLSQLGEFSFLLLAEVVHHGLITDDDYRRMLFIALGTLILTPMLLRLGLRWTDGESLESGASGEVSLNGLTSEFRRALIIGMGLIGRRIATLLETGGYEVVLIDLSPVNLHPFAQQGFRTLAGDARDREVLQRAGAQASSLAVVSVPDDEVSREIVTNLRSQQPKDLFILVRCRFELNIATLKRAGANYVVSEELEAADKLLRVCEQAMNHPQKGDIHLFR